MKKKNITLSIILLSVLFVVLFTSSKIGNKSESLNQKLETLSSAEREYLENFFKYTLNVSTFGYVLFGDKPMGIEGFENVPPRFDLEGIDYMDDEHILERYRLREGFEVWKKIEPLFPPDKFVFISYTQPEYSGATEICLINVAAFLSTVKEHLSDFQKVLNSKASPLEIFEDYIRCGHSFKVIRNHDGLFGTLLGFGRNNAWAYFENSDSTNKELGSFPPSYGEEIVELETPIFPLFRAQQTIETENLFQKYTMQRNRLIECCREGNFSVVFLQQFSSGK